MHSSLYHKFEKSILYLPQGSVIAVADFYRIAKPKTISKILTRISETGLISKVMRSIFWKPTGDNDIPDPNMVAAALARQNNWEYEPSGETALHLYGITDKKPTVWTYVTNGTYRKYTYGDKVICFTHTNGKLSGKNKSRTRLFIQCLKAYGKDGITEETFHKLASGLRDYEKDRVIKETEKEPAWISRLVLRMFKKPVPIEVVRKDMQ